ncbi:MAG: M14 family zinc carboxypeptidase [Planctomycetota bacterium]
MHPMRLAATAAVILLNLGCVAQTPIVTAAAETMRIDSSSVSAAGGGAFSINLVVDDDNGNGGLPTSFRRWWHCQVGNLNAAGVALTFTVDSVGGYTDIILPVWALSTDGGATFSDYARCPLSAVPQHLGSGRHRFTVTTPPGTTAIRLAKYFPYTVARKDQWLLSIQGHAKVRSISTLGTSLQGRPIQMVELTDPTVPDAGKARVWIHAGIHPSESTSYFTVEGLVEWLLSNDPYAQLLLDRVIFDIVPMANPDGVFLGNYRVSANSTNLENEWASPYTSAQPEIIALRTAIEGFMGTVGAPAANPLEIVLNLHSSHGLSYPFHFQHVANAGWTPGATGVLPIVNQREGQWITAFRAHSPFVDAGSTQSSTLSGRPFVESMMHDRWTAVNGWLNAPNFLEPVMAITFEGTYGLGPDQVTWNTEADYRLCGAQMGRAMCDYFGLVPTASLQSFGASCQTAQLLGQLSPPAGLNPTMTLTVVGAPANALLVLAIGTQQINVPLPAPWSSCNALVSLDDSMVFFANLIGIGQLAVTVPPVPGLFAYLQVGALDASFGLDTTNGLFLQNQY